MKKDKLNQQISQITLQHATRIIRDNPTLNDVGSLDISERLVDCDNWDAYGGATGLFLWYRIN